MIELSGNLIIEDGKILLLYRDDEEHWEVPGGKFEPQESPTEAAKREAEEEIGVEIELEEPFYSGEFQHDGEVYLWHGYVSKIVSGSPEIKEKDKFSKLEWFAGDELDNLELTPNLEMILPALRKVAKP